MATVKVASQGISKYASPTLESDLWTMLLAASAFYVQKVAVTIELLCPANDTIMFCVIVMLLHNQNPHAIYLHE